MKAIFMGTPEFATHSLNCLKNIGIEIALVITQPDKVQGRKKEIIFSPVKQMALELELPIKQYASIKSPEAMEDIADINPDLIIVAAYGQILPKTILEFPKYGCINIHASLLPKYRGASPINHAILDGQTHTGITTMFMDVGMDTGDIILQDEIVIEPEDNTTTLTKKLAVLSEKTLTNTINLLKIGTELPRIKQDEEKVSYAPMLKKEDGKIDFNTSATSIINKIRAFNPWPICYTSYRGKNIKIYSAKDTSITSSKKPGTITNVTNDSVIVATKTTDIQILEIQKEGKTRMSVEEYLRGNTFDIDTQFE